MLPLLTSVSTATQADGSLTLSQIFPDSNNYLEGQSMYEAHAIGADTWRIANSSDTMLTAQDMQANNLAEQVC